MSHRLGSAFGSASGLGFRCAVCGRRGLAGLDLCGGCLSWLPVLVDRARPRTTPCLGCGEPTGGTGPWPICRDCASAPPAFARTVAPYRYAWPLDKLVRRWKGDGDRVYGRVFGTLLGRAVASPSAATDAPFRRPGDAGAELVLAVPSHPRRTAGRGFDHTADLARWTARTVGLPVVRAARRVEDTGSLAELSRAERALRIRGAFAVDAALAGRRLAIVDDVLTSGATARELARECYDTGAASVELWTLARTPADRM